MNKIFSSIFVVFVVCTFFINISLAFQEPPLINVVKPTGGETYYIDAAAGSGGDGSLSSPWNDLEDADGGVSAGSVVKIKAGTYDAVSWNKASGTIGNEIVLEAFGDGDVIIEGENRFQNGNLIVDGGTNRNIIFKTSVTTGQRPVRLQGDNITLWRIKVIGPTGDCDNTNNTGILIKGYPTITMESPKIFNSVFEDCSHKSIYISAARNGEIKNNIITGTGNTGLQVNPHEAGAEVADLTISGNIFYNNGSCSGLPGHNLYMQSTSNGDGLSNVVIKNNYFWDSGRSGIHLASICGTCLTGEIKILNNTFYNNGEYGVSFDGSTALDNMVTVVNNIIFNNASGNTSFGGVVLKQDSNNLTTDPSFVSTIVTDSEFLQLTASSVNAIDLGADLSIEGIIDDFFGNLRSDGSYDIGAHEFGAKESSSSPSPSQDQDTTPPDPPSGLAID